MALNPFPAATGGRFVGMSRPERYDEALTLAAYPVPDELWSEIDALTPAPERWLS